MSKEARYKIIKSIEKERESSLISYVTSIRSNMEVQMAMDMIRKIYTHLMLLTENGKLKLDKIDLFLVSNGGDGTVPWRLVTLLREYTDHFSVLIPYRAFSAATLTALGANEIIMHSMGMLGPTDPTVSNQFNPDDPNDHGKKLGISVEDVSAYISLIKDDAAITHEDELVQAFNMLARKVHPLALGNVKRSIAQSRLMAQKLLQLHMNKAQDQHIIKEIVDNLTSKSYYHGHPINRKEAKNHIGLKNIITPNDKLENLIWNLYIEYENELQMDTPFDPLMDFIANNQTLKAGDNSTHNITSKIAFIECSKLTEYVEINHSIFGTKNTNGSYEIVPNVMERGWKTE